MVWAILNPAVSAAVDEFSKSPSDRVAAILGSALVEESLLRSLELRFRQSSVKEVMFKPGGTLGDFFAKINLGYLLYMYERPAHSALLGIAGIRNVFAHQLSISRFDAEDAKLREGFERLSLHSQYKMYPAPFWDGDTEYSVEACNTRREIFVTNIKILLILLMRDMHVHVHHGNTPIPLPKLAP
jgi:hypothetical protein